MSYTVGETNPRFEQQARHSKEDALTDKEYERLYEGAQSLPDEYYSLQSMFIVTVAGRLGLRRAEIAHMDGSWIDWGEKMIAIPRHESCDCGDCAQKAEQVAEHNNDVSAETAMDHRWHPKTKESIREVPFDFSARVELIIERFFERFDEYPLSVMSVTRRVNRAAENSRGIDADDVYPHALRATAASYHAGRGLGVLPLQALMGWCDLETPLKYVKQSGKNTSRELRGVHNR